MTTDALAARLENELYNDIPLVRALALKVSKIDSGSVQFLAPLLPNINDKGCAFGGSLASLLTLACWGVLRVETWRANLSADIFVHTSRLHYLRPVWENFRISATLKADSLADFMTTYVQTGKAVAILHAVVEAGDECAARIEARFVAMRPKEG